MGRARYNEKSYRNYNIIIITTIINITVLVPCAICYLFSETLHAYMSHGVYHVNVWLQPYVMYYVQCIMYWFLFSLSGQTLYPCASLYTQIECWGEEYYAISLTTNEWASVLGKFVKKKKSKRKKKFKVSSRPSALQLNIIFSCIAVTAAGAVSQHLFGRTHTHTRARGARTHIRQNVFRAIPFANPSAPAPTVRWWSGDLCARCFFFILTATTPKPFGPFLTVPPTHALRLSAVTATAQ